MISPSGTDPFYRDLPAGSTRETLCDFSPHRSVPGDWLVVIADIADSTRAIEGGHYKNVNIAAAAAITAVLNAAGRDEIAYVFGGDGATFLIPPAWAFDVAAALYGTREMARESFGLRMRAGIVSVADLLEMQAPVRAAKMELSPGLCQAVFSGEGITVAEKLVKGAGTEKKYDITSVFPEKKLAAVPARFTGLECRWKSLPARHGTSLALIVQAQPSGDAEKTEVYREVLEKIKTLCGTEESWKPVSAQHLRVTGNPVDLSGETRARTARESRWKKALYLLRIYLLALAGKLCLAFRLKAGNFDGKTYRQETERNSDYIKFDNVLRLVMDVTPEQQRELESLLTSLRQQGKIRYGLHAAPAALMTCMVFDYASRHFHFIDGADGGYALAAKHLKQQSRE